MTTKIPLSFPSTTSLVSWAGVRMLSRLDDAVYVCKDDTYFYYGWYPKDKEYRLLMTSSRDLGAE